MRCVTCPITCSHVLGKVLFLSFSKDTVLLIQESSLVSISDCQKRSTIQPSAAKRLFTSISRAILPSIFSLQKSEYSLTSSSNVFFPLIFQLFPCQKSPSMKTAIKDLKLDRLTVIYPGDRFYSLPERVHVVPLAELGKSSGRAVSGLS